MYLKDDAYYYTTFATGELRATLPTVLCSAPLKLIIYENGKFCGFRFHSYLRRCRTGMVIFMNRTKKMIALLVAVITIVSMMAIPASALVPSWNSYIQNNFPEQRVGYYHYGYTYMIQRFLYVNPDIKSYIVSSGGIDGMFGNGTKNAVRIFQDECNSSDELPDIDTSSSGEPGKVGRQTWYAIAYAMSEVYPGSYEDWWAYNKKVARYDYETKQLKYFSSDNTVGGLVTTLG